MTPAATALTSWAKAIRKALDAAGVDSAQLFSAAGLDLAVLDDPNARYHVAGTTRLWRLAVEAVGDDAFGLTVVRHVGHTTFHALGYSLLASSTLREAFERTLRYFRLVTDAGDLSFAPDGAHYRLTLHPLDSQPEPAPEAVDAFALLFVRLCRGLHERNFSPARVHLRRPAPRNVAAFERRFRAPLVFGAAENALWFDRATCELPLAGANPELARHNEAVVLQQLAKLPQQSLRLRVQAALIQQLSLGEPSQEQAAAALHMSLRNFQRKLAEEGTSYSALLDDTRQQLALAHVRDARYSLSEITYLLGFADASSFNRAFKRWTGVSPSAYRAEQSTRKQSA